MACCTAPAVAWAPLQAALGAWPLGPLAHHAPRCTRPAAECDCAAGGGAGGAALWGAKRQRAAGCGTGPAVAHQAWWVQRGALQLVVCMQVPCHGSAALCRGVLHAARHLSACSVSAGAAAAAACAAAAARDEGGAWRMDLQQYAALAPAQRLSLLLGQLGGDNLAADLAQQVAPFLARLGSGVSSSEDAGHDPQLVLRQVGWRCRWVRAELGAGKLPACRRHVAHACIQCANPLRCC